MVEEFCRTGIGRSLDPWVGAWVVHLTTTGSPSDGIWNRILSRSGGETTKRDTALATPSAQNAATTGRLMKRSRGFIGAGG